MVTISVNDQKPRRYANTQFRYGLVYACVTFLVLLFLNLYTSKTSQMLFYKSKETSMIEKCQLSAAEISKLDVINTATISQTVNQMEGLNATRIIVTDAMGAAIYDSNTSESALGQYVIISEIVYAMEGSTGNDVFCWRYYHSEGVMYSRAATPIVSYGQIVGCLYIMEADAEQGALIQRLQNNILTTSLILMVVVILFSILFATVYSTRLHKVSASMRVIRDGDYSHRVVMGGRDELTFLGDEFNLLTARLQVSEDKRRRFVSDASHELKTPLASIKLLTDSILQNDMDIGTVREFVGDIGNEADRLNRMTQKLLSLSHIDGQQDGVCEIVRMKPTIDRVLRMLRGIAEKSEITIETQLDEDSPILILEDDLYQITFNLVENGIKYNMPGGKLFIRTYRKDDNAVLEVRDTGSGIPEEAIPHLFERFYRVDKARSRSTGGSGLGLAIVRNMVERNQGTIHVSSVLDQGSVFTVEFPAFDPEEVSQ